ncbi:MAG TPA: YciI family protein [Jiangellaceae bacterium]|nr:YciI family protein [Jiangellaceae bacterium]
MTQYMLSAHTSGAGERRPQMTEAEISEVVTAVRRIEAEMRSAGAWVFGGRLHDPSTATVVRPSGDDVLTTDGPFAETKDHLGGFYIVNADDLDGALRWASQVATAVQAAIEVRPLVDEMPA